MSASDRPVLFVTNHVPPDRVGAFAALHARETIELALFGGRSKHATGGIADPGVPHRHVAQSEVRALAASGRYRAVVAGTAGRVALPAAYRGARQARVPFLLWSALWAHPRTPAHALSLPLLRHLYRSADAVVAYGPHVAAYVRARGGRNVHVAPQAVDNGFWSQPADGPTPDFLAQSEFTVVFVGRDSREKGLRVLRNAWRASGLESTLAALVLVGAGSEPPWARTGGAATPVGVLSPPQVRNFYAQADVVVIPSIATASFREPWGLVANEAMNQHTPIIATDAVGAAAGGLVRHERNGLVVPAGDADALGAALLRLHEDAALRARLGEHAARDVAAFTFGAWAAGFGAALETVGAGSGC
jgi:glycosyltransferase involved in cell wall biosynthesis